MRPRLLPTLLLALPVACGGGSTTLDDCRSMDPGPKADECWADHAAELFRQDAEEGVKIVTTKVQDPRVRDYIWLTVTREVDPSSFRYCDRIQEEALARRCRVLVSRPHLHRELVKGQKAEGPQGAGGGPPPGAGGPPPVGPGAPPPQGATMPPPRGEGGPPPPQGAGGPPPRRGSGEASEPAPPPAGDEGAP